MSVFCLGDKWADELDETGFDGVMWGLYSLKTMLLRLFRFLSRYLNLPFLLGQLND